MMFCQVLVDLKDKYFQCLQLLCIFSQEIFDSDLFYGCIDGEKLQLFGVLFINFCFYDEVFICGLVVMMDDVEIVLKVLGMLDKIIYLEWFNMSGMCVKCSVNV